jgi:hypothetical protein
MSRRLTLDDAQQVIDELVEMGLMMDSGRRRDGQVLYVLTPLGKSPEGKAILEAREAQERGDKVQ